MPRVSTQATVANEPPAGDRPRAESPTGNPATLVPVLACVGLLVISLFSDGGFAVRHWAPVGVFALVVLVAMRRRPVRGAPRVAVLALWGLAGWTALSALWADSPGSAVEAGARTALYAALFALAVTSLHERRPAQRVAAVALGGLAALVLVTYLRVLIDPGDTFLAGRLDDPVGYRNGTAALFVLAFWPLLCVAATRRVAAALRGPAFALAVIALGLAFLTQSRGALIGFAIGGAVALAVGPDRLRRAWLAIVALGAIALASGSLLEPYDAFQASEPVTDALIEDAAATLGLVALLSLVAALLLALFDNGLRIPDTYSSAARGAGAVGLALLAVGAGAAGLAATGNPVDFAGDKWDEFRSLDTAAPGETRFGSTGGQRYDLYKIALREFEDAPLVGVGGGSYRFRYYEERESDRNLTTPHSLPLGLLAETGIVGALLFALFLGAIAATFAACWRTAATQARRWGSAAAAAGAVLIGQCTVDWLWEIPGLAGLGVLALGLAVTLMSAPQTEPAPVTEPVRARPLRIAASVAMAVTALLVCSVYLSDFEVRKARAADSAQAQYDAARAAERLNPTTVTPLLLQAGALEDLGRVAQARAKLGEARDLEPRSFVLLALRGDLEIRAGRPRVARSFYRQALALNPADVGLQRLAGQT